MLYVCWINDKRPFKIYSKSQGLLETPLFLVSVLGFSPLRFGSVACGVGQELYVFGGVRSQENGNPEQRQMMTCKSEFYHDEMRRWETLLLKNYSHAEKKLAS